MIRRLSLTPGLFVVALTFALTTPAARAQGGSDIFVTPIPNVPFLAIVQVERSFAQGPNGPVATKSERQIARDDHGRIYNELRTLVPATGNEEPVLLRVHLYDPQTRISTMMNVRERTFSTMTVNRPPATVPPGSLDATPAGNTIQQNEFTTKEDLGMKDFGGTQAHGVRQTQRIPADANGSGKEITVVDEYWYSDDLRMNLLIKHNDPRSGSATLTVTKIQRTEPDPAMFEIPADYQRANRQ